MPLLVTCPCRHSFQVGDDFAGQQVPCPACQTLLIIPVPSSTVVTVRPIGPKPAPAPPPEEPPTRSGALIPLIILGAFLTLLTATGGVLLYLAQQREPAPTESAEGSAPPEPAPTPTPVAVTQEPPVDPPSPPAPPPPPPAPPPPAAAGAWRGHSAPVLHVAFESSERYLLSASGGLAQKQDRMIPADDNSLRQWEIATGRQIHQVRDIADGIAAAAFSPDGKTAALAHLGKDVEGVWTPDADTDIHLWDVPGRRRLRTLEGHAKAPFCLAFSADGRRLLSGGPDRTVRLWDLLSGREVHRLVGHTAAINAVAFSPDGRLALSASGDRTARLWDLERGAQVRQLPAHLDIVWAASFSPNGTRAVSAGGGYYDLASPGFTPGSRDHAIRVWEVPAGKELHRLTGHEAPVTGVAFSRDGRRLLSADRGGNVLLWHVATGRLLHTYRGHTGAAHCVAFFPDARRGLSGGDHGEVRLWTLPPDVPDFIAQLEGPDAGRRQAAVIQLAGYGAEAAPAIPALLRLIPGAGGELRREVLAALGRIGSPGKEHVPLLVPLLEDASFPAGRQYALDCLVALEGDARTALRPVHAVLADEDPVVRRTALRVLGGLGQEARELALLDLIGLLADAQVGMAAGEALEKVGPPTRAHLPDLRRLLGSPSPQVRLYVVESLRGLGARAEVAADDLVALIRGDMVADVRRLAIKALLDIRPRGKPFVDALQGALSDPEPAVCREAIGALVALDLAEGTLPALLQALEHAQPEVAGAATTALGTASLGKGDVPVLARALAEARKDPIRLFLIGLLVKLKQDAAEAVPALAQLLERSSGDVRRRTLAALIGMGPAARPAGPALARLLGDREEGLALEVALGLASIKADEVGEAIPRLIQALHIADPMNEAQVESRKKASAALVQVGRPAVAALTEALDGPFAAAPARTPADVLRLEARLAAVQTLGEIGCQGRYPEVLRVLARIEGQDTLPQIRTTARELRIKAQKPAEAEGTPDAGR